MNLHDIYITFINMHGKCRRYGVEINRFERNKYSQLLSARANVQSEIFKLNKEKSKRNRILSDLSNDKRFRLCNAFLDQILQVDSIYTSDEYIRIIKQITIMLNIHPFFTKKKNENKTLLDVKFNYKRIIINIVFDVNCNNFKLLEKKLSV